VILGGNEVDDISIEQLMQHIASMSKQAPVIDVVKSEADKENKKYRSSWELL